MRVADLMGDLQLKRNVSCEGSRCHSEKRHDGPKIQLTAERFRLGECLGNEGSHERGASSRRDSSRSEFLAWRKMKGVLGVEETWGQ